MMRSLLDDIRSALTKLVRKPLLSFTVVVMLTVGLGINTALFAFVKAVLVSPLRVDDPEHLLLLHWTSGPSVPHTILQGAPGYTGAHDSFSFPYITFDQMAARSTVFSSLFGFVPIKYGRDNVAIRIRDQTRLATGVMVTGAYFSGLGVKPALGRLISEADEGPAGAFVAVISYRYWKGVFGGADVVGSTVAINGTPFNIVGVAQDGFTGLEQGFPTDVWLPIQSSSRFTVWGLPNQLLKDPSWWCLVIVGRLRSGTSVSMAQTQATELFEQSISANAGGQRIIGAPNLEIVSGMRGLSPLADFASTPLLLAMVISGVMLLAVCINVLLLVVARAFAEGKETAVRVALGITVRRIYQQRIVEALTITSIAGMGALLVAYLFEKGLIILVSEFVRSEDLQLPSILLDYHVVFLCALVCGLTGVLLGFISARSARRLDIVSSLKDNASVSLCHSGVRGGEFLLILQIALSAVILTVSALLARTFYNLTTVDLGFRPQHLTICHIQRNGEGRADPALFKQYLGVQEQLRNSPGISAATSSIFPPMAGPTSNGMLLLDGVDSGRLLPISLNYVGPDFFATLGIDLLIGRDIQPTDLAGKRNEVILNRIAAQQIFGEHNPVGNQIRLMGWEDPVEVIGVVNNARYGSVRASPPATVYLPYTQLPSMGGISDFYLEVRSSLDDATLVRGLNDAINRINDERLTVREIESGTAEINAATSRERFLFYMLGTFAVVMVMIVCFGIMATFVYSTTRRSREFGVRMALGATREQILGMVVRESVALGLIGVSAGLPIAVIVAYVVRSLLYGISFINITILLAVTVVIIMLSVVMSIVPGFTAGRVDPNAVLQSLKT